MERQPAKVLRPADVRKLLRHVSKQRYPDRATVIALLSFRAGLRACEISGLKWSMVLASNQRVSQQINIARSIAKKGSGRCVPVHPELKSALIRLHNFHGNPSDGPVIRSERDGHMTPGSIVNWFRVAYDQLGLSRCSSHSGRRTFITMSARLLAKSGGSLRDIQELAGHRSLSTTERYIEGDREAQRRLIKLL